jgi:hypothetical protein
LRSSPLPRTPPKLIHIAAYPFFHAALGAQPDYVPATRAHHIGHIQPGENVTAGTTGHYEQGLGHTVNPLASRRLWLRRNQQPVVLTKAMARARVVIP